MTLKSRNILIIDDTAAIRTFLRISLQAQGAIFYEAETAEEGVRVCKSASPDMVVLDLGLPDKDGLEILAELKTCSPTTHPIILVLTVRKEQFVRDQALALGANAYLTKPFLMEDLLETMEEHFKTYENHSLVP